MLNFFLGQLYFRLLYRAYLPQTLHLKRMNNNVSSWFTTYNHSLKNQAKIFAFPYSGAGASVYLQWASYFSQHGIDFIGVQLPGRENRRGDKPLSNLSVLIDHLLSAITPYTHQPFVFFGHSLGALVAFELSRALHKKGLALPKHLFVSAFRPPSLPNPNKALHQLEREAFIDGIRAYGNTPEAVLSNTVLMDMFLPMLRADFALNETYCYKKEAPLSCPITVFKGSEDSFVNPNNMGYWQQETQAKYEEVEYKGHHFFLDEHKQSISQRLVDAINHRKTKSTIFLSAS